MLDNLNELLNGPFNNIKIISPDRTEQAGLTIPPTAIGRPTMPTIMVPQPTDQAPAPTDTK